MSISKSSLYRYFCRRLPAMLSTTAALAIGLGLCAVGAAKAQTYQVIHNFTGGRDGAVPRAGLSVDGAGNLFGTTFGIAPGGNPYGTVFEMKHVLTGWILNPLYDFGGGGDGAGPNARVVLGPDGSLYGTTTFGGQGSCNGFWTGCGTVYKLRPSPSVCHSALCPWTKTVLYAFSGGSDGLWPYGDLTFDHGGNIYGTTYAGGGPGTVYELTPTNGGWTETVLYHFSGGDDGRFAVGGVIFDGAGNLYGTTEEGGGRGCDFGCGTVFELTPSGPPWTENVLHGFQGAGDGAAPTGGFIFDGLGNIYGATTGYGSLADATVFQVTPSNGGWTLTTIYDFGNVEGPQGSLTMDAAGNLYGTTLGGGRYGWGAVFKLTPALGGWTYSSLYDFCAGGYPCADGAAPYSNIVFDSRGNIFGTASRGGTYSYGVVFQITP